MTNKGETMTFNQRVTIIDEWAVTDNEDGSQTRARLEVDHGPHEPERGAGMWNEGITLYRIEDNYHGTDLDDYEPMENILSIIQYGEDRNTGEYRDANEWMFDKEQVCRYFRIFHDAQFAEMMTHRDYRDTAHILVVAEDIEDGADPEAIARATFSEWDAWASGDVYVVVSETRTLTEAMEDEEFSWTEYDWPVGGFYGEEQGRDGVAEALGVSVDLVPENAYEYMNMV